MSRFTDRDRQIGNTILAILFALGALAFSARAIELVRTAGFSLRVAIWILAAVGMVSLFVRSVRDAVSRD